MTDNERRANDAHDRLAVLHLKDRGYTLDINEWAWCYGEDVSVSELDQSAADYLTLEWDFGGICHVPVSMGSWWVKDA